MPSDYDLSLDEIILQIKESGARRVLIQLPDGLKPEAERIQRHVAAALPGTELFFWSGSCFGACDIPLGIDRLGFDLLLHLGHAAWR